MAEDNRTRKEILEDLLKKVRIITANNKKLLNNGKKYVTRKAKEFAKNEEELERFLENALDELNGTKVYPTISSNDSIDYKLMEEIAYQEVYQNKDKAHGAISIIRNILQGSEESVGTNEELVVGYHGNKLFTKRKDWSKHLEKVVKLYVDHIVT